VCNPLWNQQFDGIVRRNVGRRRHWQSAAKSTSCRSGRNCAWAPLRGVLRRREAARLKPSCVVGRGTNGAPMSLAGAAVRLLKPSSRGPGRTGYSRPCRRMRT
jgi:hypothetical protein